MKKEAYRETNNRELINISFSIKLISDCKSKLWKLNYHILEKVKIKRKDITFFRNEKYTCIAMWIINKIPIEFQELECLSTAVFAVTVSWERYTRENRKEEYCVSSLLNK